MSMSAIVRFLFAGVFVGIAVMAVVVLFRSMLGGARLRASLPYQPVPIIFPPIPVEQTFGVTVVGVAALVWSGGHLILACGWFVTDYLPRMPSASMAAAYVAFAGVLVGCGGAMILRSRPFGRRLISWGMMLLAILAGLGMIVAILIPKIHDAPPWARRLAVTMAVALGVHAVLDIIVGALASRVGRPPGYVEPDVPLPRYAPDGTLYVPGAEAWGEAESDV